MRESRRSRRESRQGGGGKVLTAHIFLSLHYNFVFSEGKARKEGRKVILIN